jgi:hypothetical protein
VPATWYCGRLSLASQSASTLSILCGGKMTGYGNDALYCVIVVRCCETRPTQTEPAAIRGQ